MGIGFRQSKHDTQASRKIVEAVGVAFDSDSDFSEGDRVMTVDGVPGTVVGVHLGFVQGAESYDVTLDDNLGGGEYTSSQLSKQPAHTGSLGSAVESYPELGTILVDRPDPAKIVTYASKKKAANSEQKCKLCGEWVDVDFGGMKHHMERAHGIEKSSMQHQASILATAAVDPDFRFHVTASWSDVRNKAKRIRSEGGVHITATTKGMFHAEVRGDHGVYETSIQRLPGKSAIANWSCGCKWGSFHWGAPDDFSRFAGRMCSHALALQHEAQSRGMFGRNIEADDAKPSWVPKMVKVKYDIDSGHHVEAPHTKVSSLSPLSVMLARTATLSEREAILAQVTMSGVDYDTLSRTAASAWRGEPTSQVPSYLHGATSPAMPETNPASTGFATSADPKGWQEAAEHPTPLSQQYAMRREAYDNPLGYGGAYPTGHYIDLDEIRRQVYKRVAPSAPGTPGAPTQGAPASGAPAAGAPATGAPRTPGAPSAPAAPTQPRRVDMNAEIARGVAQMAAPAVQNAVNRVRPVVQDAIHTITSDGPRRVAPVVRAASLDDELGFEAVLHDEPEGALPFTEGGEDEHDKDESVVDQFQRSAAARFLSPTSGGGSGDIADAAKEFLAKEALKSFTPAEQSMIINEGKDVRARNRDRMNITGTHYEDLEKTFSDDEWMS